jgi:hypothetical protein
MPEGIDGLMPIKKIFLKWIITLVQMTLLMTFAKSQERHDSFPGRIMFYNMENFFDVSDNPEKEDNEFLPSGIMRWNRTRYLHKINSVSKTIIAAGGWYPPAIIGFCEVENKFVIEDLVNKTTLSNYGYGILHEESPDPRGIDVGMLFRKDIVSILYWKSLIPRNISPADFHSRSVLYSKCILLGDTLHVMINHWPSRRGGALAGEFLRKDVALMLRNTVDSIYSASLGSSKIVIMGDFNCRPDDPVLKVLINSSGGESPVLVNLADSPELKNKGTYKYQGRWELLDQVIISDNLLEASDGLYTDYNDFKIFRADFLIKNDLKYPGLTTYHT